MNAGPGTLREKRCLERLLERQKAASLHRDNTSAEDRERELAGSHRITWESKSWMKGPLSFPFLFPQMPSCL